MESISPLHILHSNHSNELPLCPNPNLNPNPNPSLPLSSPSHLISLAVAGVSNLTPTLKTFLPLQRTQNTDGCFYVDHSCIDCGACQWMAPDNFLHIGGMTAVSKQPESDAEWTAMLQSFVCCPTASIHAEDMVYEDLLRIADMFPLEMSSLPGIYHCGFHSTKSFGATAYLIQHPAGNILVDSPRYNQRLAKKLDQLGGIRYMFLTHKDAIADHERWRRRFLCDRIMHIADMELDTLGVEMKLEGNGPWSVGLDFDVIFTPGYTEGSVCLLHKPLKALFSGNHVDVGLLSSHSERTTLPPNYKYSVSKYHKSLQSLLPLDFLWILPGHLKNIGFKDLQEKNAALLKISNDEESLVTKVL